MVDGGRMAGRIPLPDPASRVPLAATGIRELLPAAPPRPPAASREPLALGVVRPSPSFAAQSWQYTLSPSVTAFSTSMRELQPSQYWSCMA